LLRIRESMTCHNQSSRQFSSGHFGKFVAVAVILYESVKGIDVAMVYIVRPS
jgi:hypothetical protein